LSYTRIKALVIIHW